MCPAKQSLFYSPFAALEAKLDASSFARPSIFCQLRKFPALTFMSLTIRRTKNGYFSRSTAPANSQLQSD